MADTYKISTTLTVTDAVGSIALGGTTAAKVDCGPYTAFQIQVIGTAAELLDVGAEITGAGLKICAIRNLDENNFVTVYSDNGTTSLGTVPAGDVRIFEADGDFVPYLKADTANVRVKFLAVSMPLA